MAMRVLIASMVLCLGCSSAPIAPTPVKVAKLTPAPSSGSENTVDYRLQSRVQAPKTSQGSLSLRYELTPQQQQQLRPNIPQQVFPQRQAAGPQQRSQANGAAQMFQLMQDMMNNNSGSNITTMIDAFTQQFPQMKQMLEKFRTVMNGSSTTNIEQIMRDLSGLQPEPSPAP